jgi:hypothetical protein
MTAPACSRSTRSASAVVGVRKVISSAGPPRDRARVQPVDSVCVASACSRSTRFASAVVGVRKVVSSAGPPPAVAPACNWSSVRSEFWHGRCRCSESNFVGWSAARRSRLRAAGRLLAVAPACNWSSARSAFTCRCSESNFVGWSAGRALVWLVVGSALWHRCCGCSENNFAGRYRRFC